MKEMVQKDLFTFNAWKNNLGIDSKELVLSKKNFYIKKMDFKLELLQNYLLKNKFNAKCFSQFI